MFLGWREEYCKMVVQLCSWIFELCSCIWKICVQWQLKVEDRDLPLKNCSNYPPPSNSNVTDNPPLGNRPEKSLQLPPPLEFTPNVEFVQLEKILRITPDIRYHISQDYLKCWAIEKSTTHKRYGPIYLALHIGLKFLDTPLFGEKGGSLPSLVIVWLRLWISIYGV